MFCGTAVRCRANESALPADLDPPAPIVVLLADDVSIFKATCNERRLRLTQRPEGLTFDNAQSRTLACTIMRFYCE